MNVLLSQLDLTPFPRPRDPCLQHVTCDPGCPGYTRGYRQLLLQSLRDS